MNEEFEKYIEMAQNFLAKKERVNYYQTEGVNDEFPDYCYLLAELNDDEVGKIRALKAQYGEDFVNHLNEVIDDEDVISDMFCGDPIDIDLDHVHHQYAFTIREVQGEKVSSRKVLIQLSDEDYAKLLAWHLYDSNLVLNTLFYRDEELCRKIMRESMRYVSDGICSFISNPFVLTIDEALADADAIRQENGLTKSLGYVGLFY